MPLHGYLMREKGYLLLGNFSFTPGTSLAEDEEVTNSLWWEVSPVIVYVTPVVY